MDESLSVLANEVREVDARMERLDEKVDKLDDKVDLLREDAARAQGLRESTTKAIEMMTKSVDVLSGEVRTLSDRTAKQHETLATLAKQHDSLEGRLRKLEGGKKWGAAEWAGASTLIGTILTGIGSVVYALMGRSPPAEYMPPVPNPIAPAEAPASEDGDGASP